MLNGVLVPENVKYTYRFLMRIRASFTWQESILKDKLYGLIGQATWRQSRLKRSRRSSMVLQTTLSLSPLYYIHVDFQFTFLINAFNIMISHDVSSTYGQQSREDHDANSSHSGARARSLHLRGPTRNRRTPASRSCFSSYYHARALPAPVPSSRTISWVP